MAPKEAPPRRGQQGEGLPLLDKKKMEGEAIHKTSPKGHTDSVQMKYKSKTGESMVQPCKELKMEQRRGGRRASPFLMYTGRKGVWPLKRPRPGTASRGRTSPTRFVHGAERSMAAKVAPPRLDYIPDSGGRGSQILPDPFQKFQAVVFDVFRRVQLQCV